MLFAIQPPKVLCLGSDGPTVWVSSNIIRQ